MKVADYVVDYLEEKGINHAFGVTGGVIVPLVDAYYRKKGLEFICTTQEQGAAMAAEAYSRVTGDIGVAMATSGPGATNLITGMGCAYFDSIPSLYITGQVSTLDTTNKEGPRQIGFQETDIVTMVKPITKFSHQITNSKDIKYYLDKAIHIAKSGRPGPVLLDLPMNIQLEEMNTDNLRSYSPKEKGINYLDLKGKVNQMMNLIEKSERPVMILGSGIKLAGVESETRTLVEKLGIPVVPSWGAIDVLPHDNPLFVEGYGVSHNRAGNFTVQNSDLLISLGSRLDTRQTGIKAETFGREAKKVVVDIDEKELYKNRGMEIDVGINYNLKDFFNVALENKDSIIPKDVSLWKKKINDWKEKYPICLPEYFNQKDKVNPYVFMEALSDESKEGETFILDTGSALTWGMQGLKIKEKQKLFSAFGNSPMGYSLPASIGASFASNKGNVNCITGDGGFKMNLKELETIVRHNLPIKVFVMNNHEYGMIKQFQDVWFGSRYAATEVNGGLGEVDLLKVSKAYGVKTIQINNHSEMKSKIKEIKEFDGPVVCSVEIAAGEKMIPKLEFGKPIEDSSPQLNDKEFEENMIIKSLRKKMNKKQKLKQVGK